MSRVDELLETTLGGDTAPDATGDGWNQVTRRGEQLVRRRRVRRGAAAGTLVIAVVVVGLVFVQKDSGDKTGSIATNPTSTSSAIVASVGGDIVTLDPADGHMISRLVENSSSNTDTAPSGVAVTPDGTMLYYTKPSADRDCGANVIVERTIATGAEQDLVCGTSPIVSPDGQWIAYTNADGGFQGDFLAITSLPTKQHYRPYEQLLGEQPSKVQPLAWSPDDHLLWNRFHTSGSSDQQTYQLNNAPLDHGDQPTLLAGSQPVSAAAYAANGDLVVATGSTDRWTLELRNDNGSAARTRFEGTGPMPTALAAAPDADALLLTMPDGRLLIQEGTAAPRKLATGVHSATWLKPQRAPDTTTTSIPSPPSTTAAGTLDVNATQPTFEQQVAQLERWYHNWPAEAPGGRPDLAAEFVFCDYRNNPDVSGFAAMGIPGSPGIQQMFASYSKLSEPLTEARIVDGCINRRDRFPGDTPANVPVETPADELPPYLLCTSDEPGPVYGQPGQAANVVLKPAVVFSGTDCAAAGFSDPPANFVADLDRRRHIEIEIRAVPKDCPTADDAQRWVEHITKQELGEAWTAGSSGTGQTGTGQCFRPHYIDWANHTVGLLFFNP